MYICIIYNTSSILQITPHKVVYPHFFLYLCTRKTEYMRYLYIITALMAALVMTSRVEASEPMRQSLPLNDNWRFFWADRSDIDDAEYVALPHVWAEQGGDCFMCSTANYIREIYAPKTWNNKRIFLRFGGVQCVANIFLNDSYVGEHRGAYTAFTCEITDYLILGERNLLRVIVSNGQRSDMLPLSTDLNIEGGIYRDVELIVTERNAISPLYYSSDGVLVEQHSVTAERVEGVVKVALSASDKEHLSLDVAIFDDENHLVVAHTERVAKIPQSGCVELPYKIDRPKLWSPSSPSLYLVRVRLIGGDGVQDEVEVMTGFRRIGIDEHNKLSINGERVDVRGVGIAHDRRGLGSALSVKHLNEDYEYALDMGANALRSLSGPHPASLYERCDREGTLVWVDMPFTRAPYSFADICYYPTEVLRENGFEQLKEIIIQNFNHPSIVMWGLFSLVWQRGDDVVEYVEALNDLAHSVDGSRMTVGCSNSDGKINFITDLIVLRQNVGWMKGSPADVEVWCRQLSSNSEYNCLRYAVCYGEEGVMSHQSESIERARRNTRLLPERRQTFMHERYADILTRNDIFWGLWIDNLFDYGSSRRTYGVNNAGLVDFDHAEAKDGYYLYRAMWNEDEPTLHITNRRWTERRDTLQYIDVYSSVGEPMVLRGGDTLSVRKVGVAQWRADSVVVRGDVVIRATDSLGKHHDAIRFRVVNSEGCL